MSGVREVKIKSAWQVALSAMITDPKELFVLLQLDETLLPTAYAAAKLFPLKVTHSYVARMKKNNIHDPLLKQVLPLNEELLTVSGYTDNPLQENKFNPVPGLLHKYHGRVLVTLTSACAIHCRYCFRRSFPYADNNPGRHGWQAIFNYIAADLTITEVILSGGDPLAVNDSLLKEFCEGLATIPHVQRVRFHTRLPIVLPERITNEFIQAITKTRLQLVMVIHCNHSQEINEEVRLSLYKLHQANIPLLNQSVLLKSINDDVETLKKLSEDLFASHVMPYYLHVLDKVAGAAHFDLPLARAEELHAALRRSLPGYLVPKLVREESGKYSKTTLG